MTKAKGSSLSERLKSARAMSPLSARELDQLAGLSYGHTSAIENGTKENIESRTAQRIAMVLGLSLDWLIAGKGAGPDSDSVARATTSARRHFAATGTES